MQTYKYILTKDLIVESTLLKGLYIKEHCFSIEDNYLTIYKGYMWNGCTLAIDTSKTYNASCLHDLLYTYGCKYNISKDIADKMFYNQLKKDSFIFAKLYYWGVRLFGEIYYYNN